MNGNKSVNCKISPNGAIGDFVVGPENRLVKVAIGDLLRQAGSLYSPLVLHGPSGVGKTHLAMAVAAHWKARPDHPPVKYAVAIDFARELAEAIETKTLDEFGVTYRRASLLVLEDLQHLAGKQAAQRELLQILDSLADNEALALVTVSRSPGVLDWHAAGTPEPPASRPGGFGGTAGPGGPRSFFGVWRRLGALRRRNR